MPGKTNYLGLNTALHDDVVNHETHLNENWNKIDETLSETNAQLAENTNSKFTSKNIVEEFGAIGDGVNDDGALIQQAIDSFNTTNVTWSTASVGVVLIPPGDFLIKRPLRMREGVYLFGVSKYASRLRFDFSESTNGIVNTALDGTTFNKNFGFSHLAFLPDYNKAGVGGSVFMNFKEAIEPYIHDCRFIMHKGAVGGGQLDATAIKLDKCQHVDFFNIVFDGGKRGIEATGTEWGVKNGRMSTLFFYNQMHRGISLGVNSNGNNISNIQIEQLGQVGDNIGVEFDATSGDNMLSGLSAHGVKLKYGLVVHSAKNILSGIMVKEALTKKINITNPDNTINSGIFSNPDDKRTAFNEYGKQILKTTPTTLSTVNTWYTVANVRLGSNGTGVYVTAHISDQVEGVGMVMLKKGWFIERGTLACSATENTADKYSNGTALEFQWVAGATNNDMNLQVRFISGTAVNDAFVILEMSGGSVNDLLRNGAS